MILLNVVKFKVCIGFVVTHNDYTVYLDGASSVDDVQKIIGAACTTPFNTRIRDDAEVIYSVEFESIRHMNMTIREKMTEYFI